MRAEPKGWVAALWMVAGLFALVYSAGHWGTWPTIGVLVVWMAVPGIATRA